MQLEKRRRTCAILAAVVVTLIAAAFVWLRLNTLPRESFPAVLNTEVEVDAGIRGLKRQDTRLQALEALIELARWRPQGGSVIFTSGDPHWDALADKAHDAIAECKDFDTIKGALNSDSEILQSWAIRRFPGLYDKERELEEAERARSLFDRFMGPSPKSEAHRWRKLLPRLRQLAKGPNAHIRGRAQECLWHYQTENAFIADCLAREASPYNIHGLLKHKHSSDQDGKVHEQMNARLLLLLNHSDEAVRADALNFVGGNWNSAEVCQVKCSDEIFERALELSRSPSGNVRAAAVYALAYLRNRDIIRVCDAIAERVHDTSEDVRWRIPLVLQDQLDRPEAQSILAKLRHDPSPLVRQWAIQTLGREDYQEEYIKALRELAARQGQQEGWLTISSLISFIGQVKAEEHIGVLFEYLDYLWQKSQTLEYAYPAVQALTQIGKPASKAALADLAKEQTDLRVRLLARVISNVEGLDDARRLLESEAAKASDAGHKRRLLAAATACRPTDK